MPPADLSRLDAWIAAQPAPRPTRPEAMRSIVRDWLASQSVSEAKAMARAPRARLRKAAK
jgi:hypothetical protein